MWESFPPTLWAKISARPCLSCNRFYQFGQSYRWIERDKKRDGRGTGTESCMINVLDITPDLNMPFLIATTWKYIIVHYLVNNPLRSLIQISVTIISSGLLVKLFNSHIYQRLPSCLQYFGQPKSYIRYFCAHSKRNLNAFSYFVRIMFKEKNIYLTLTLRDTIQISKDKTLFTSWQKLLQLKVT